MMALLHKIKQFITDEDYRWMILANKGFLNWMDDEAYIRMQYKIYFGRKLNLEYPETFNEKLQWLKLHDRRPEYTMMSDKYLVKDYISEKLGEKYIIPTLGVWENPKDINFDDLPEQFVLKCNHNSGLGMCICTDKTKLDIKKVRKNLKKGLKQNFYLNGREWPYKNIKPRILAEKYIGTLEDVRGGVSDYKFYCFHGEPEFLYVSRGLENPETARICFLTLDWKPAPFRRTDYQTFDVLPPKPVCFEKMMEAAKILSEGIPFVRVDLYELEGQVLFSELTFFPCAGYMHFEPEDYDWETGKMLDIKKVY